MSERYQSFEEFWPFYLREHAKPATRWMHFVGTHLGLAVLGGALATGQLWAIPAALVPGYGFAWVSHFFIEKNRPATFTYPLWSLLGDFKLMACMWTGKIGHELERHVPAAG